GGNKWKATQSRHSTWFHHQFAENKTLNNQRQETIRNKREKDASENMQRKGARKAKPGKQGLIQCVSTAH
ncbi:hypothetical protein BDZ91DRAFT_754518, partial [Kalaharituber pfeilii]